MLCPQIATGTIGLPITSTADDVAQINTARDGSAGDGDGGGIYNLGDGAVGTLMMNNTIIANSSVLTDCMGSSINSGSVADNGGDSWTYELLSSSPAIDAADAGTVDRASATVRPTARRRVDGRWTGPILCCGKCCAR